MYFDTNKYFNNYYLSLYVDGFIGKQFKSIDDFHSFL